MPASNRRRELGRGERVRPGIWRLRLPLPWPGVPHCNAWALAAGDGIVLVDTGMHEPGSLAQLELALGQVGLSLEHVRLLVCTHAHADHYGQAAPIVRRAGCELWMHPNHAHGTRSAAEPGLALQRRIEIARQCGVPEEPLRRYAERHAGDGPGVAAVIEPDRELVAGVEIETDHGRWTVHETPGHAPSHVCLHQAGERLLISGDHLLGRVSPYFDYGHTPDPVGEFLDSLRRVDALDARLCLSGHGRPFADVRAHVVANERLVRERGDAIAAAIAPASRTVLEILPEVYGEQLSEANAPWFLAQTLAYLVHLEAAGRAVGERGHGGARRWSATGAPGVAELQGPTA